MTAFQWSIMISTVLLACAIEEESPLPLEDAEETDKQPVAQTPTEPTPTPAAEDEGGLTPAATPDNTPDPNEELNQNPSSAAPQDPFFNCDGKTLSFTHDIVDEENRSNFNTVNGIGIFAPPSHTIPVGHTYIGIVDQSVRMPIYAPATARLWTVGKIVKEDGSHNIGMSLSICDGIGYGLGHISELSPEIRERTGCNDACDWRGENQEPIEIEAGTIIGYKGGPKADGANLDFGTTDISAEAQEIPGGADVWGRYLNNVCPYSYFADADTKAFYETLLVANMVRTEDCGTLSYEQEGTLQGYWFDEDTARSLGPGIESQHLVLAPSPVSTTRETISTGSFVSHGAHFDASSTGQINRSFADVSSDGNKYCYEDLFSHPISSGTIDGFIVMEMVTSETLTVEYVDAGNCPADPNSFTFTGDAFMFVK